MEYDKPLDLRLGKKTQIDDDTYNTNEYAPVSGICAEPVSVSRDIRVKLKDYQLWRSAFMEMIITQKGRRMFPIVSVSVEGMNPVSKYSVKLQILPTDPFLYKYVDKLWVRGRYHGFNTSNMPLEHEESPNNGTFWSEKNIGFNVVKLTNCYQCREANFVLKAMQKYCAWITIVEYLGDLPLKVYNFPLPETTFIAVTAYHNREVVDLKIGGNPFAKAFREKKLTQNTL